MRMSSIDLMRRPILVGVVYLAGVLPAAQAADIKPADARKPLFRVLAPVKIQPGAKHWLATVEDEHPLVVVWSVRDLVLAKDAKGVLITLHPKDAKLFAAATQKYNHGLLFPKAMVACWRPSTSSLPLRTAPLASGTLTRLPSPNTCAAAFASVSLNESPQPTSERT
jgi:hypothetical protein